MREGKRADSEGWEMMGEIRYIGTMEKDDRLKSGRPMVIYGAGKVGRETLEFLREKGREKEAACFCDNNPQLWGSHVEGLPVLSLPEAYARYPQGTYLIASLCVRQMLESLLLYGIEEIHIIREG